MHTTRSRLPAKSLSLSNAAMLATLTGLALLFLLLLPASASAQSDAIRVMAGRVLENARFPNGSSGRAGGIRRDDDRRRNDGRYENSRGNRRDDDRWRREQKAREKFCRKNPRERVCRYGNDVNNRRDNNAAWCWDRNRDARCDVGSSNRRGSSRGGWWGRR